MSLLAKLQEDMKFALKNKESVKLSAVRMLISSVSYAKISKGAELTDDEVLEVLAREAKKRKESAEAAKAADRPEMAERELCELDIINAYLPAQLSEDEIEAIVREVAAEVGAADIKDKGKMMGKLMPKLKGKADGNLVNQVVERILCG